MCSGGFPRNSSEMSQPNFSEFSRLCLDEFFFLQNFSPVCLGEISWMGLGECSMKFSVMSQRNLPQFSRVYFLEFSQNFVTCISSNFIQIFFYASWRIFYKNLGRDTANFHEVFSGA